MNLLANETYSIDQIISFKTDSIDKTKREENEYKRKGGLYGQNVRICEYNEMITNKRIK